MRSWGRAGWTWWVGQQTWVKVVTSLVVLALAVGVPLALSRGGSHPTATPKPVPSGSPSASPTRSAPRTPPVPAVSPLTGVGTAGKVLAVKVDNVGPARAQQVGLNSADVVYVIQVEAGLSRYLAIYDSNHAPPYLSVGPVRSARQTDLPLLAAYGRVALAYSGAISGLLPELAKANLIRVTPSSGQFSHGGSMPTFIAPARVFRAFPGAAQAKDVGFRFGPPPALAGVPVSGFTARMPAASFRFRWSGSAWLVSADGRPAVWNAANVIVQHVRVVRGRYTDFNAGHPDNEVFSWTTGRGAAEVYRNGRVWRGTWAKASDRSPTTYTVGGAPMTLAPGRTWVVLLGS